MRAARQLRLLLSAFAFAGLAGCEPVGLSSPPTAAAPRDIAPPEPIVVPPSAESIAARDYYARVEQNYLAQGLLRVDDGSEDAPFTARDLAENFLRIAFYEELAERDGELVSSGGESRLHRWQQPVRIEVVFGASIPTVQRSSDRAEIATYAQRLSRLTGLPIRLTGRRANHTVLILNTDERKTTEPQLRALVPGISAAAVRSVREMRPDIYCTVFGFTPGQSAAYTRAITVIRGELPERLRRLCIHEELAQSLGLIADYPRARPSIFNDNEEFALLTRQDELMLRMLYDPRLRPGMTLQEARPIVATIAAELMGGES
ncbi:hypothetical protein DEA8626_00813 [Defluviimonas aquaemixtae]|uniref:DUF2927 domain-containing protein n=2 Tax=Albidovulum aquaemixtae TaxID=1542388 RepID=A0A2R8B3V2_9RHOB|nr:hypothetical protein DEA8626_00813 [Defluviimonas aquaemixtae]